MTDKTEVFFNVFGTLMRRLSLKNKMYSKKMHSISVLITGQLINFKPIYLIGENVLATSVLFIKLTFEMLMYIASQQKKNFIK